MTKTTKNAIARRTTLKILAAAVAGLGRVSAWAQKFPSRPIKIVVGNAPGSLDDILGRLIGPKITEDTGQPVLVENRAGAGATLAADQVAKSAGDGYSLLLCADSVMVFNPFVYQKLSYDATKDFEPVAILGKASQILIVSPSLNVKTFAEFVALAKSKPKAINYGSAGAGSTMHIVMELIANRMGFELTHVPYKGPAPAIQALMAGEVSCMIVGMAVGMPQIRAGRVLALATSGPLGKVTFPNLPEFKDAHPDLDVSTWFGVFAPAGTPRDVVTALNGEFNKALARADVKQRFSDFGLVPLPSAPSELDQAGRLDRQRYAGVIKKLGLTLE